MGERTTSRGDNFDTKVTSTQHMSESKKCEFVDDTNYSGTAAGCDDFRTIPGLILTPGAATVPVALPASSFKFSKPLDACNNNNH